MTEPACHLRRACLLALAFALAAAVGCGEDEQSKDNTASAPPTFDAFAVAADRLAMLDTEADELHVFDVAAMKEGAAKGLRVPLPHNPSLLLPREGGHDEWLVLTRGLRGVDTPPRVVAIDAQGERREYPVTAPYTALRQTDDGRFALLSFEQGAQSAAFPTAQLAVIDLDSNAVPVETDFSLRGAAPARLWLSPALTLDGRKAHFVLADAPQTLGVLALEQPSQAPSLVSLTGEPARGARILDLVFLPGQARAALLADGLDDLFIVDFIADRTAAGGFRLRVTQHAAGHAPSALAAAGDGGVLVLSDEGTRLHRIEASTGARASYDLPERASHFAACEQGCAQVLLYRPLSAAVSLVDLERIAAASTDALTSLRLAEPVSEVRSEGGGGHVRCIHEAGSLTLIDLDTGASQPLGARSSDARAAQATGDGALWLATAGASLVTHFAADTHALGEVLLRAPVAQLLLVPDADSAVIVHTTPQLAFTVLPLSKPGFGNARYVEARLE